MYIIMYSYDYLFFLLIEVFNDDTDEQIQGKKWTEYDKEDEVQVHVNIDFSLGLLVNLLIIKKHQILAVITVIYLPAHWGRTTPSVLSNFCDHAFVKRLVIPVILKIMRGSRTERGGGSDLPGKLKFTSLSSFTKTGLLTHPPPRQTQLFFGPPPPSEKKILDQHMKST